MKNSQHESTETRGAFEQRRANDNKNEELSQRRWIKKWGKETEIKRDGLIRLVFKGKICAWNERVRYCEARKTLKHIVWKRGPRTQIFHEHLNGIQLLLYDFDARSLSSSLTYRCRPEGTLGRNKRPRPQLGSHPSLVSESRYLQPLATR